MSFDEGVKPLEIPLQDLLSATNGFAEENRIGYGGFGTVYKGESPKYGTIAIKRLDSALSKQGHGDLEFKREIALLSKYKHENIVSLVGFSNEAGEKILVYKYETKQSLDKHISSPDLTWTQRLQICLDAALGLKYLHHDVPLENRIIHRDIKSANILLDENFNAKISDFGLCEEGLGEHSFLISNACGTPGYIDPDYFHTGQLTQKSDVFSFGIVLFEVLCGRPAFRLVDGQYFYIWVRKHYKRRKLYEIIHSGLREKINPSSLVTFSAVAYRCLSNGEERPTMKDAVEQLQKALEDQNLPQEEDVFTNNFSSFDSRFNSRFQSRDTFSRFDSFHHFQSLALQKLGGPSSRFDSMQSTSNYNHGFRWYNETDPFGSDDPFKTGDDSEGPKGDGFVAGQAAFKAESSKMAKHEKTCLENQHMFVLFAFDTFGVLVPDAV